MQPQPTPPATTCYRHPDRSTVLACSECGRPICTRCSIDAAVGQRCPECVRSQGRQKTIDMRARLARPTSRSSPLTMGIIGVTVAIHLLSVVAPVLWESLTTDLAMINGPVRLGQTVIGVAAGEWWRMLTVVLLHANLTHILFNMWALYNLGPQIERELGWVRFLSLYLASAAAGSAFAFHLGRPADIAVGASGAIFGLFGVWLASAYRRRRTRQGRFLLNQIGFILLINAALPLVFPQISWQAHLGGLIGGFLIGQVWGRVKGANAYSVHVAAAMAVLLVSILSTQIV